MGVDGNYFGTRPHYYEPLPSFRLIAYSPPLEDGALPNVERIKQAIRDVLAA